MEVQIREVTDRGEVGGISLVRTNYVIHAAAIDADVLHEMGMSLQ